jgi:hypothetical protein
VDSGEEARRASLPATARAPILVFLPGIMGSHLDADNSRVWLAPLGLARGALSQHHHGQQGRRWQPRRGLVGMAYGKLVKQLGKTHEVRLFPYDWRQPIHGPSANSSPVG